MKYILIHLILGVCLINFALAKENKSLTVGKIVKTKHENEGTNYFIVITKNSKTYAYPISEESRVKNLDLYRGKMVKVFGYTDFRKSKKNESNYIMSFIVHRISELSVKDLSIKEDFQYDEVEHYLSLQKAASPSEKQGRTSDKATKLGLNDTAVNSAIFVGGAALAAEVLGQVLK